MIYQPGDIFSMPNADTTLYAAWGIRYTITYDGNGATEGEVPVDTTLYELGDLVIITGNPLARAGYVSEGWSLNRNKFGPRYGLTEGSTIAITHDLIMYAAWSRVGDNSGTGIIYDSTFNFNHPKEIFTGLSKNITYTTTQYTTESIVSTNSPVIFGNGEKFDTRIKFKNIVGSFTKDNGTYTVTYTDDVVSNGDKTNLPFFRYTLGGE